MSQRSIRVCSQRLFASALLLLSVSTYAEESFDIGLAIQQNNRLVPDITYLTADNHESKLDVIGPRPGGAARPVLLYIHGGGWVGGSKDRMYLHFIPYLQMGMAVVNVGYRLGNVALAPAAVEDARCALRWVYTNAEAYGLDTSKIVVSGHSAGGHLSLTTGMLPADAGLDGRCPVRVPPADGAFPEMPVAAIVNWFGITDVGDLVRGPNAKTYAMAWMGAQTNWQEISDRVSPINYVHKDLPPILTIHGDADPIVPYAHATNLHKALKKKGVVESLHTIPGGGHGGFSLEQNIGTMNVIREFLTGQNVL
ncbi:MAG: alpha/beta fold hydrolase [Pseudomonadales bacterium]|nr:alpha/beta fold hydrolase [Pseudomonadales bacterium]